VRLLRRPLLTLRVFVLVALQYAWSSLAWLRRQRRAQAVMACVATLLGFVYLVPGPQREVWRNVEQQVWIGVYWTVLGVLSSIGLGSGLHTFVLYLGPFIAKATVAAYECGSTRFSLYGPEAFVCPPPGADPGPPPSPWSIFWRVQSAALFWGVGTALGELPPYFVARAARLSGQRLEALDEALRSGRQAADAADDASGEGLLLGSHAARRLAAWVKRQLVSADGLVARMGFWGIAAFASIPNPLFDLAGLSCGHTLVPFVRFFAATLLGKAFVKAHMQAAFVVLVFSEGHLDSACAWLERHVPFLQGRLLPLLESERLRFHHRSHSADPGGEPSLLSRLWALVLVLMISYFLVSFIDSTVQSYLHQRDEEDLAKVRPPSARRCNSSSNHSPKEKKKTR
jgi:hypothetical protein